MDEDGIGENKRKESLHDLERNGIGSRFRVRLRDGVGDKVRQGHGLRIRWRRGGRG